MVWLLMVVGCAGRNDGPPPSVGPWSEDGIVTEYKPVVGDSLDRLNYGQAFMELAFAQDLPQVVETGSQGELPGGRQRGLLSLQVDANGQLLFVTVSKSCGFEDLDQAVLEQVRSKSSYPAPKPELLDERGELALESVQFEVEVLGTSESEWRMQDSGSQGASNDGYLDALAARFYPVFQALFLSKAKSINPSTGRYTMVLSAALDQEGQVAHAAVKVSSGLPALDQVYVEGFEAAAPYGAPPKGRLSSDGLYWLPLLPYEMEVTNNGGELDFGDLMQSQAWAESTTFKVVFVR